MRRREHRRLGDGRPDADEDAFPAVNPRPTAPDLTIRTFEIKSSWATHVKFVVVDNQCTGTPSYLGEQDNDPTNPTNCRGHHQRRPGAGDRAPALLERGSRDGGAAEDERGPGQGPDQ